MKAAVAALDETQPATPKALLTKVGMTLVSTVGGASGPLFGTFFLRLGGALGDSDPADAGRVRAPRCGPGSTASSRAARPSRATRRCTTRSPRPSMPWKLLSGNGALPGRRAGRARDAAAAGRDATIPLQARKGRASYLGERSIGHQDPGATTVALLFQAATEGA